ncbi:MAG: hypothetical protein R3190_03230 [Thermoanaerobaculia bacterium]|nr:hypothetical protein [Thermoanaerobaculia bacterium]
MSRVQLIAIVVLGSLVFARPAAAYLDPGTGSMILQMLIGGVAGALVVIRMYWHRIVGRLRGRSAEVGETDTEG